MSEEVADAAEDLEGAKLAPSDLSVISSSGEPDFDYHLIAFCVPNEGGETLKFLRLWFRP